MEGSRFEDNIPRLHKWGTNNGSVRELKRESNKVFYKNVLYLVLQLELLFVGIDGKQPN